MKLNKEQNHSLIIDGLKDADEGDGILEFDDTLVTRVENTWSL